jgi:hypothetical protein
LRAPHTDGDERKAPSHIDGAKIWRIIAPLTSPLQEPPKRPPRPRLESSKSPPSRWAKRALDPHPPTHGGIVWHAEAGAPRKIFPPPPPPKKKFPSHPTPHTLHLPQATPSASLRVRKRECACQRPRHPVGSLEALPPWIGLGELLVRSWATLGFTLATHSSYAKMGVARSPHLCQCCNAARRAQCTNTEVADVAPSQTFSSLFEAII